MALPTRGRVIVSTTVGEIDIELWSKETPKTCRNFLALAMEGYYDGVIFHRIVTGFLVQTGDKTGTGGGGESFFGGLYPVSNTCLNSILESRNQNHSRMRYTPDFDSLIVA